MHWTNRERRSFCCLTALIFAFTLMCGSPWNYRVAKNALDAPRHEGHVVDGHGVKARYNANRIYTYRGATTLYNVIDADGVHYDRVVVHGGTVLEGSELGGLK